MSTESDDLGNRVIQLISRSLKLDAADCGNLRMGATPGWDSMGHMMLVLELEREFKVTFPTYRIAELVDIPSILKALS